MAWCTKRAVTARAAHTVMRLPVARQWMRGGEVLSAALVESGGGAGHYLVRGEGAGRRGDGEVVERARPSGARRHRRGYGG
jgi:hypothetical protein